jgi:hypothetical protein
VVTTRLPYLIVTEPILGKSLLGFLHEQVCFVNEAVVIIILFQRSFPMRGNSRLQPMSLRVLTMSPNPATSIGCAFDPK